VYVAHSIAFARIVGYDNGRRRKGLRRTLVFARRVIGPRIESTSEILNFYGRAYIYIFFFSDYVADSFRITIRCKFSTQ